jgi:hypothetical protein
MPQNRIRVAPNTVAYADEEKLKLVVEFAIPGAPSAAGPTPAKRQDEDENLEGAGGLERDQANFRSSLKL